jgi:hypothetical protein
MGVGTLGNVYPLASPFFPLLTHSLIAALRMGGRPWSIINIFKQQFYCRFNKSQEKGFQGEQRDVPIFYGSVSEICSNCTRRTIYNDNVVIYWHSFFVKESSIRRRLQGAVSNNFLS